MPLACMPFGDAGDVPPLLVNSQLATVLIRWGVELRPFHWTGFFRSGATVGEVKDVYYRPKRGEPLAAFEPLPEDGQVPDAWHALEALTPSEQDIARDQEEEWIFNQPRVHSIIDTYESSSFVPVRHTSTPIFRSVGGLFVHPDLFSLIADAFPSHYWVVLHGTRRADPNRFA